MTGGVATPWKGGNERGEQASSGNTGSVQKKSATAPRRPKLTVRQRVKKTAWRMTAIYAWVWFVSLLIFGARRVDSAQSWLAYKLSDVLSSVGFAPPNGTALPMVLKVGWPLVITGFGPIQIAALPIYIF